MKKLHVTLKGLNTMMMHSPKTVNPLHPLALELKKYTSKRKKTEDDLQKISDLEWEVFMNYLDGKSYQETARELHRHIKSIDNALQRVKRKVEKYKEANSGDSDIQTVCSCILSIEPRKRDDKKDT